MCYINSFISVSVFIFILTFNDRVCDRCVRKLYDPCYRCKKTIKRVSQVSITITKRNFNIYYYTVLTKKKSQVKSSVFDPCKYSITSITTLNENVKEILNQNENDGCMIVNETEKEYNNTLNERRLGVSRWVYIENDLSTSAVIGAYLKHEKSLSVMSSGNPSKYNIYPIDQYNPTCSCDLINSHKKTKFNILLK
ncbi:hypothetical protein AGLY_013410 [Aphis glycines]|uniref:PiggyBac transposable element-derived protein domain-containing protein n=1 Tax=Aphis glycines TaxID=307491 RepID=A0A6G0T7J2_APHGL|nr:hypothetical protein AGLY_013410 [Aphis glycines]